MKHFMQSLCAFAGILLVLLFTAQVFCTNGESIFLFDTPTFIISRIYALLSPFLVPLVASITGIFSASLLKKHDTWWRFVALQAKALLVPFAVAVLILLPLQQLFNIAPISAAGASASTAGFFTQITQVFKALLDVFNLTSGIAASQLSLLLYFFVFALIALALTKFLEKIAHLHRETSHSKTTLLLCGIVFLFIPVNAAAVPALAETFVAYIFGFFVLSQAVVQSYLLRNRHWICATWLSVLILYFFLDSANLGTPIVQQIVFRLLTWLGIVGSITVCSRYFNGESKAAAYLAGAFFPFFYFSQTITLFAAVAVNQFMHDTHGAFVLVCGFSILLITALYELLRRFAVMRVLFGIKSELYNENF